MFDDIDFDLVKKYGSMIVVAVAFIMIAVSGVFFGTVYLLMDTVYDQFQDTDCTIDNNVFVSNCQELWELALYPFLEMKEILIWFSYLFIFALVIGLLVFGYQSGNSPVMMGFLILVVGGLVYLGIILSNMYQLMLANVVFREMMIPFVVYNKIMLYFPWFVFFVGLMAGLLSIVNWQKPRINSDADINNY